jgi:Pyruvate/2-oxoacid:ferredoxin oxidoreductase delta subunit
MPTGPTTAEEMAKKLGRNKKEIETILESMATKGLCMSVKFSGIQYYQGARFVLGIFEYQFIPGKSNKKYKKIARLVDAYKKAYNANAVPVEMTFPSLRVIPVDSTIEANSTVHIYDQVQTYIDKYEPIAVGTCYCRHEVSLLDGDTHGVPMEVCMYFDIAASFAIERLNARKITKDEAREIINMAEEKGLIHTSINTTEDVNFICNCDRWNCAVVRNALAQQKPGLFFNSGFQPKVDMNICVSCGTCIERCPSGARKMNVKNFPEVDLDRCFGCAVCATGCPSNATVMINKPDFPNPPKDMIALGEAIKASRAQNVT